LRWRWRQPFIPFYAKDVAVEQQSAREQERQIVCLKTKENKASDKKKDGQVK